MIYYFMGIVLFISNIKQTYLIEIVLCFDLFEKHIIEGRIMSDNG